MNFTVREILEAAARRGLATEPLGEDFLVLDGRIMVQKTRTPFLSAVALKVSTDKQLCGTLLREAGLPVPEAHAATNLTDTERAFLQRHGTLAVKPCRGDRGLGVTLDVRTNEELERAWQRARPHGPVLLERQVAGRSYRVFVIDGRPVAAYEKRPPHVDGDGRRSVFDLVEALNADPRRGPAHLARPLLPIAPDGEMEECLEAHGLTLDSVPEEGRRVTLRTFASLSTGGDARDVTDQAHPENLDLAARAAALLDVDVAGVDLIAQDLNTPGAVLLEVNSMPGVRGHLYPAEGLPRPVLDLFLDYLFQRAAEGRPPALCPGR